MRKIIFYRLESGKCPVEKYLNTLSDKQTEKVFFVLDLIEQFEMVPREYFKKMQGTDDIWEVRVQHGNNIFRLLGFWDGHDVVVLNHAFTKKTQKVPRREKTVAEQRKQDYLQRKSKP